MVPAGAAANAKTQIFPVRVAGKGMAEGKWISGLTANMALAEAARRTLGVRLQVVHDYLQRVLAKPFRDPEHVHQLRVGTRRAVAALQTFACCLPRKVYKRARRRLRRLRQAAGQARDWDVFLAGLSTRPQQARQRRSELPFLIAYAAGQRLAAQKHLEQASLRIRSRFDQFQAETVAAVREPDGNQQVQVLLDLARPMLLELLSQLDEAARQNPRDYTHLHGVRIVGKRLRYAMEIFVDCFATPFRASIYPSVEEMQDILGRANDSHQASLYLAGLRDYLKLARPASWQVWKKETESTLHYHRRRLLQERRRFQKWWQRWQTSKMEARFISLLKTPAPAS